MDQTREYRVAPWYVGLFVVFTAAAGVLLHLIVGMSWSIVAIAPIGGSFGFYGVMTLKLGPAGVSYLGREAAWEEVMLKRTKFGVALVSRPSGTMSGRVNVPLWTFEWDWLTGRIGHDFASWPPGLLQEFSESEGPSGR